MENQLNKGKAQMENNVKLQNPRRRSSFFGYNSAETYDKDEKYKSDEIEFYKKKLIKEINDWPAHYADIREKLSNFWCSEENLQGKNDNMTKEQQDFLAKAVDVNEYLKQSKRICEKAENYILKKEWFLERHQFCIDMMQDKLKEEELALSVANRNKILNYLP